MAQEVVEIIIREKGAAATSASIKRVGTASSTAASAVRLLSGALAALGVGVGLNELRKLSDVATQLDNRVRTVTATTEEFNAVQARLREVANNTLAPIQSTTEIYQRLRVATRDLGASQKEVLDLTEGLNAALKVSGADGAQASAALLQLSQALASGRLQGDELRSVLENAPVLAQRLAAELGVTVGELRALGASGELTSAKIFPALQRAVAGFTDQLKEIPLTSEDALTILQNGLVATADRFNDVLRAQQLFTGDLRAFGAELPNILLGALASVTRGFGDVLLVGADVMDLLENLGLNATRVGSAISVVISAFKIFFAGLETGFRTILLGAQSVVFAIVNIGNALGFVSDAAVAEAVTDFQQAQAKLIASARETEQVFNTELLSSVQAVQKAFTTFGEDDRISEGLREAAQSAKEFAAALEAPQLPVDSAALVEPGAGQKAAAEINLATKALEDLKRKQLEAKTIDNRIAVAVIPDVEMPVDDADLETWGERLSDVTLNSVGNALSQALRGEGFNFADALANLSGDLLEDALRSALDAVKGSLATVLDGIFNQVQGAAGGATGGGGAAGGLGGAGWSAGIGLGIGILAGALRDSAKSVQNGLARSSAVQNVQATRGIVAGPTSVSVFQLGAEISSAFKPSEALLTQILRAIQGNGSSGGGGSLDAQAGSLIGTSTPSLA